MTAQLGFGLKLAQMQLWLGLLESSEFSFKDLLRLSFSYAIYYLPGINLHNYIEYIIIIDFRNRFS